jgi:hypothetical protein
MRIVNLMQFFVFLREIKNKKRFQYIENKKITSIKNC